MFKAVTLRADMEFFELTVMWVLAWFLASAFISVVRLGKVRSLTLVSAGITGFLTAILYCLVFKFLK